MKLKSIAGICKKSKFLAVYDRTDTETGEIRQFIGDGAAIYPAYELPYVEKESLMAIFDIPEKQRDDFNFVQRELPNDYNLNDTDENEEYVKAEDVQLITAGKVLKAMRTRNGVVFIDTQYLKPVTDVLDVLEFYERETPDGVVYIAAKAGYLLQAVILPFMAISETFTQTIENLAVMCREALDIAEARRAAEEERQPEQTAM